ncbi:RB1-inducible coiled-coil protein [Acrasis kona]|uniref:RB1-inducible coiled-coil protein n=1 Tax=Acrasis kona TaxID=1008807 RepID=A0AAW2YNH9_9EUKA
MHPYNGHYADAPFIPPRYQPLEPQAPPVYYGAMDPAAGQYNAWPSNYNYNGPSFPQPMSNNQMQGWQNPNLNLHQPGYEQYHQPQTNMQPHMMNNLGHHNQLQQNHQRFAQQQQQVPLQNHQSVATYNQQQVNARPLAPMYNPTSNQGAPNNNYIHLQQQAPSHQPIITRNQQQTDVRPTAPACDSTLTNQGATVPIPPAATQSQQTIPTAPLYEPTVSNQGDPDNNHTQVHQEIRDLPSNQIHLTESTQQLVEQTRESLLPEDNIIEKPNTVEVVKTNEDNINLSHSQPEMESVVGDHSNSSVHQTPNVDLSHPVNSFDSSNINISSPPPFIENLSKSLPSSNPTVADLSSQSDHNKPKQKPIFDMLAPMREQLERLNQK